MPEGVKDMDGDDDALVSRLSLSGVQDMTHSFGNSPSSISPRSVDSISKKSAGHVLERLDERRKKDEDMIKDEDMGEYFVVEPSDGVLRGNEEVALTVTFVLQIDSVEAAIKRSGLPKSCS